MCVSMFIHNIYIHIYKHTQTHIYNIPCPSFFTFLHFFFFCITEGFVEQDNLSSPLPPPLPPTPPPPSPPISPPTSLSSTSVPCLQTCCRACVCVCVCARASACVSVCVCVRACVFADRQTFGVGV